MRCNLRICGVLWVALVCLGMGGATRGQGSAGTAASATGDEIPIEKCDVLPVVRVQIDGSEMRFLLDTGATTILNLSSFTSGRSKEISVTSWTGTAATSAKQVRLPELVLGAHRLKDLKLPAIDLSPIGKACGAKIDGILGVDLLDRMGVTIDLKRQVASLAPAVDATDAKAVFGQMESQMHGCTDAFEQGNVKQLQDCFDAEIVLYTPDGEYRGRKEAVDYLQKRYMKYAPDLCYIMTLKDVKTFGDALWYSYDYEIKTPNEDVLGHGMSMCRKSHGKWVVLNLHNSLLKPEAAGVAKNE